MGNSLLGADPLILVLLLLLIVPGIAICYIIRLHRSHAEAKNSAIRRLADVYRDISPLTDFQWQETEPLKVYSLKSKYHLTMGLETLTMSELVAIDNTYLERVKLRRRIMAENVEATVACNPAADAAVAELHTWVFGTYLPRRFPTMFSLSEKNTELKNLVTNENVRVRASSPTTALHDLGAHVDTDFLLLLPSSTAADGQPIYHLEAFITCFPSGFSTRSKLSKPLADIHRPVPGYAAKLERSMDRYFARVNTGTVVKRVNWTITTTDDLFVQAGTHLYDEVDVESTIQRERDSISINKCRLRSERQTLHRLSHTGALVFAFKTYQYRLQDVKACGDGPALADAIEGLASGSVPEMHHYKRGVVWGDVVTDYLRQ